MSVSCVCIQKRGKKSIFRWRNELSKIVNGIFIFFYYLGGLSLSIGRSIPELDDGST